MHAGRDKYSRPCLTVRVLHFCTLLCHTRVGYIPLEPFYTSRFQRRSRRRRRRQRLNRIQLSVPVLRRRCVGRVSATRRKHMRNTKMHPCLACRRRRVARVASAYFHEPRCSKHISYPDRTSGCEMTFQIRIVIKDSFQ